MRCEEQGRLALRPRFYGPSLTCWSGRRTRVLGVDAVRSGVYARHRP